MLGILIDAIVLSTVLFFVDREEASQLPKLVLVSVGLAAVNFGISLGLAESIGLLALVPMIAVNAGLPMGWCGLGLKKALIVVAVLFVAKIGYELAFTAMLR